jgi:3-hydroxyacyl-[acyl-carrier-protein] dehydratase
MLLDNFYTVTEKEFSAGTGSATIAIDKAHAIFGGHFPGQPVVPGVCMMQIVRELAEQFVSKKLRITEGDNLKFLSVINPEEHRAIQVSINWKEAEDTSLHVNATLFAGVTVFFKFKGTLQAI